MKDKANLDILRTFAVSAVLVDHFTHTMQKYCGVTSENILHFPEQLGHAGVLAFFVHTSLVLMYSLERMHRRSGPVTLRFYVARAFRIYPLAIFSIMLIVLLRFPPAAWVDRIRITPALVISNLLLVQNLVVKMSVLSPLWSLPYEVQMYLVLPALYLVAVRRRASIYVSGLIILFCAIGTAFVLLTGHANLFLYIPCFLSGVLCYSLRDRITPRISATLWMPYVLTLIAAYWYLNRLDEKFWRNWVFSIILGLSINFFHDSESRVVNYISKKIAQYSYGIYLLHMLFLYLVFARFQVHSRVFGTIAVLLLSFGAAVLAFHALESPFIRLGRRLIDDGRATGPPPLSAEAPAP